MLSRVVGMLSKSYDKSAQEVCYTNEGVHDPAVSSDRTVASSQASEPVSRLSEKTSNDVKLFKANNLRVPSRILSLCGGGHLCIAHVGVLKALRDKDHLKYIKGVVGISAGALIGLIFALGYTIEQTERLLQGIDLTVFTSLESDSALLFYQTLCINSGHKLDAFLVSLLEAKGLSAKVTFAEFQSKVFFRCYATRLHTSDIQEFSVEKTPNHSILFALRATMCLPIIFAPMKDPFTDILYYDAALVNNMPFVFLTEEEKEHCLCVFFNVFDIADVSIQDPITVFKYALKSFYNTRNVYYLKRYVDRIIIIPVDFTKLLDCNTPDAKGGLVKLGYTKCISLLDSMCKRVIARRYSVA